jgi:CheY-like chemotaxis protein
MTGSFAGSGLATVLVVEDHEQLRLMVARTLAAAGFKVLQASDGRAALELFSNGAKIQVVVTDVVMPSMDGVELAAALAAASIPVPILFMSGYTRDYSRLPGPLLKKPFKVETLIAEVRRLLAPGY